MYSARLSFTFLIIIYFEGEIILFIRQNVQEGERYYYFKMCETNIIGQEEVKITTTFNLKSRVNQLIKDISIKEEHPRRLCLRLV